MERTTAYYVDWRNVIVDPIPRIFSDPKFNNQRRIVGYEYHMEALRQARADALASAVERVMALSDGHNGEGLWQRDVIAAIKGGTDEPR
jgi:hypothetical protein